MKSVTTNRSVSGTAAHEEYVCWSRMQAEAGQTLEAIVLRKELERRAGDGLFLWGIGNAPAAIAKTLALGDIPVRVIFSVMKSKPRAVDTAPSRVFVWRRFIDKYGEEKTLPPHSLVTSRADSLSGPKKRHYALMCHSKVPLSLKFGAEPFDPAIYRNAAGTGAPVGFSQVTALLRRIGGRMNHSGYEVNLSAWLAESYWVRLSDPVQLTADKQAQFQNLKLATDKEWNALVKKLRSGPPAAERSEQLPLI